MARNTFTPQKLLVDIAHADTVLMAKLDDDQERIAVNPPEDQVFPHVEIEGPLSLPFEDADCMDNDDTVITMHIWSEAGGSKEAQDIEADLRRLFHKQDLNWPGRVARSLVIYSKGSKELDGKRYHIVFRVRVYSGGPL